MVSECLFNGDAFAWVDDQNLFEEVLAVAVQSFEGERGGMVLGIRGTVILHLGDLWVLLQLGRAHQLEDAVDHRQFAVAAKERLAQNHLCDDAARGPHVHAFAVLQCAQQDLRRSVPKSRDVRRMLMLAKESQLCLPEITQFQYILSIHQQVLRLEIAMQNPSPMQILQCQEHLKCEPLTLPHFLP